MPTSIFPPVAASKGISLTEISKFHFQKFAFSKCLLIFLIQTIPIVISFRFFFVHIFLNRKNSANRNSIVKISSPEMFAFCTSFTFYCQIARTKNLFCFFFSFCRLIRKSFSIIALHEFKRILFDHTEENFHKSKYNWKPKETLIRAKPHAFHLQIVAFSILFFARYSFFSLFVRSFSRNRCFRSTYFVQVQFYRLSVAAFEMCIFRIRCYSRIFVKTKIVFCNVQVVDWFRRSFFRFSFRFEFHCFF